MFKISFLPAQHHIPTPCQPPPPSTSSLSKRQTTNHLSAMVDQDAPLDLSLSGCCKAENEEIEKEENGQEENDFSEPMDLHTSQSTLKVPNLDEKLNR